MSGITEVLFKQRRQAWVNSTNTKRSCLYSSVALNCVNSVGELLSFSEVDTPICNCLEFSYITAVVGVFVYGLVSVLGGGYVCVE